MAVATQELYERLLKSIQEGVDLRPQVVNVGTVTSVGDGVARIEGLEQAMASELLEFPVKAGRDEPVPSTIDDPAALEALRPLLR